MNNDIVQLVARYIAALRAAQIPIERVFVFGSAARGTMRQWSDVDVGVVGKPFAKDRFEEATKLQLIAWDIDPVISPIPLRPEDLADRFYTIGDAIRREGKEVPLE